MTNKLMIRFLLFIYFLFITTLSGTGQNKGRHFPGQKKVTSLMNETMKKSDLPAVVAIAISKSNIVSKIELFFINRFDQYNINQYSLNNEYLSNKRTISLKLPLVMSEADAERLGWLILQNAATEEKIVRFILPITYIFAEPGDFVHIEYINIIYRIRIIAMKIIALTIEIEGVIDDFIILAK